MRNYRILMKLGFKPKFIFQAQDNRRFPIVIILGLIIIFLEFYTVIDGDITLRNIVLGLAVIFIIFIFFYMSRIKSINTFYKGQLYHVQKGILTKFDKNALEVKQTKYSFILKGKNKKIPLYISIRGNDAKEYIIDYYKKKN